MLFYFLFFLDGQSTVEKFLKYYESFESRPIFETVDDMLKWAGLYNLTAMTLESELAEAGITPLLTQELITVRTFTHLFEYFLNFLFQSFCSLLVLLEMVVWSIF